MTRTTTAIPTSESANAMDIRSDDPIEGDMSVQLHACLNNNHAVARLAEASCDGVNLAAEAILTLRAAHKLARQSLEQNRSAMTAAIERNISDSNRSDNGDMDVELFDLDSLMIPCYGDVCRADNGGDGASSSYFVHRDPIRIPESWMQRPMGRSSLLISVVIIFNLALAHHAFADLQRNSDTHDRQDDARLLEKAAQLYKHTFNLFRSQFPDDVARNPRFYMAIVNNLAQIHAAMGQHDVAQLYLRQLLSTLMYCHPRNGANNGGSLHNWAVRPHDVLREQAQQQQGSSEGNDEAQQTFEIPQHRTSFVDGFLRSVSCLIFRGETDSAAAA